MVRRTRFIDIRGVKIKGAEQSSSPVGPQGVEAAEPRRPGVAGMLIARSLSDCQIHHYRLNQLSNRFNKLNLLYSFITNHEYEWVLGTQQSTQNLYIYTINWFKIHTTLTHTFIFYCKMIHISEIYYIYIVFIILYFAYKFM